MAESNMEDSKAASHVLYELLVYKEWKMDIEKHKNPNKYDLLEKKSSGNWWFTMGSGWPEEDLASAASLLLPWQISVSPSGELVAILEDSVFEIRQAKDEYNSIVGRAAVPRDKRPQFRKITWSPDSNMIAISSSDSSVRIYDCFGSLIFKIPLITPENLSRKLIVGLEFVKSREKKGEWELLIIYACGNLECYSISSMDKCVLVHETLLSESGVSCSLFSQQYGILYAAVKPSNILTFDSNKFLAGLTAWRLLNEPPYYKRLYPTDDEISILEIHSKMRRMFSYFSSSDCICKIVMSPSNDFLATLHAQGVVLIWHAPSLRFHSTLDKLDSKKQKVLVPLSETRICSHIIDIEWRKDNKLIVGWKNGTVSIHDVNSSVVLTFFGPEFLHGLPRLASASSLHGFLTLECEIVSLATPLSPASLETIKYSDMESDMSTSENRLKPEEYLSEEEKSIVNSTTELFYNTLYIITDIEKFEPKRKSIKFVQRVYRLLGVKMTTPEELFERYLKSEDFERAFEICEEYGLDVMKVYMRQWRTSEVNEFSIHQYLANVGDQEWILTECVERVPETLSGAKHLVQFGLNYTDIKTILDEERASGQLDLTEEHKRFIITRLKLLDYAKKLNIYEKIVNESSYSMKQYEKFRNQSIVNSAIDFARDANTDAIVLLFSNHGHEVLPYWLNILDNYPESIRPSKYSSILPECDGDNVPVKWPCTNSNNERDWCELQFASDFSSELSNLNYKFDELYDFNSETLTRWYKKRALYMEKYSTIEENSIELLQLGIARNIKGLEELLFEFEMLCSLVYDLNINLTYTTFHSESILNKLQFFIQKPEDFCSVMLRWIHPYMDHCCDKYTPEWSALYTNFMTSNSKKIFPFMIEYFNHILNGNLFLVGAPKLLVSVLSDCIYSYEKLDRLKETETLLNDTIDWLHSLSQETDKRELIELLSSTLNEVKGAFILIKYNYGRPIAFINEIKSDIEKCKEFISDFTSYALNDLNVQDWEDFLVDLVDLEENCFTGVSKEHCFKVYVTHLLKSGILEVIYNCPKLLSCSKNMNDKNLSFESSVEIIIEASQYYFNSSSSYNDKLMSLAKTCLILIKEDDKRIQYELDLIFAMRLLYEIGVTLLPLQVRQTEDKIKLIDMCFDRNEKAYANPYKIYELASKLHLTDKNNITLRLGQEAFKRKDYTVCSEFCNDMVRSQYSDGWKLCMSLAECDQFKNIQSRIRFINFSTIHAPSRILPQIMKIRSNLQKEHLVLNIQSMLITYLSNDSLQNSELHNELKILIECNDTEAFVPILVEVWSSGCIQEHVKELSSKKLIMIHPIEYSSLHSKDCKFSARNTDPSKTPRAHHFLSIMNCFMKLLLISGESNEYFNRSLFSDLLTMCSVLSASEDISLSLCYLLNQYNPNQILKFVNFFEESSTLYQFVLYYLSLKDSTSGSLYLRPIEALTLFLRRKEDSQCLQIFKDTLVNYKNFQEASQVTSLEFGIDSNRFKRDENYKRDTIFGLAMSEQQENLTIAIELAKKNRIAVHEVILSHIVSLLLNSAISHISARLEEKSIIDVLIKESEDSLERLKCALPSLNGSNYQQLISYFTCIKAIKDDYVIWGLTPKEHISLLKKIKTLPKYIDYKGLASCEDELHHVLAPLMDESNINVVGKLIRSLPGTMKANYNIGKFYCFWALKIFNDKCVNATFKNCVLSFETLYTFFQKLTPDELTYFAKNSILAEKGMTLMESGIRKHLLELLMNWCQGASKSDEYTSTMTYLQQSLDLMNRLWDEDREDFSQNLKNHIFLIEEFLKKNSNGDVSTIFSRFVLDLTLSPDELLYLYTISNIKEPLMSVINGMSVSSLEHSKAAEVWRKRLCSNNEEFNFHEIILGKHDYSSKPEQKDYYLETLKKYYIGVLEPELFHTNFKDGPIKESFLTNLVSKANRIEQLVVLHKFSMDLPDEFEMKNQDIQVRILKAVVKIEAGDQVELKYSLANDIITSINIDINEFNNFFNEIETSKDPGEKLFLCWICLYSESSKMKEDIKDYLDKQDQKFCVNFFDLPKAALVKIVPVIIGTTLYPKLITLLMQADHDDMLKHCIEGLEEASLTFEAKALTLLINRTPRGLRSFHTALSL